MILSSLSLAWMLLWDDTVAKFVPSPEEEQAKPQVSIIIDDIGYNFRLGSQLVNLEHKVTLAIIPYTPYGQKLASLAYANDKEVMVHAPMQAESYKRMEPGLSLEMEKTELEQQLSDMLMEFPEAVGVNNHGGSLFSQDAKRVGWMLEELKARDLYFIDSRTSAGSVMAESAQSVQIPFAERDVFLDNRRTYEAITVQLQKLKKIARKFGAAVAIGHPYPETLQVLKNELPKLEKEGFSLVFASEITKITRPNKTLSANTSKRLDPKPNKNQQVTETDTKI